MAIIVNSDISLIGDTSAPAANGQLATTALYDRAGGKYSIASGKIVGATSSTNLPLYTNPAASLSYSTLLIECDIYPISSYTFFIRLASHCNFTSSEPLVLVMGTGYAKFAIGTAWDSGNVTLTSMLPATGWTVKYEETIDGDTITVRAKIYDVATSALVQTIGPYSFSITTTGLNNATFNRAGYYFTSTGTSAVVTIGRAKIETEASFSDNPEITTLTAASKTKTSITFGGGVATNATTARLLQCSSYSGTYADVGAYTAGMTITGLTSRSRYFFMVKLTGEDEGDDLYSNIIVATTAGNSLKAFGHFESSSGIYENTDGYTASELAAIHLSQILGGGDVSCVNRSVSGMNTTGMIDEPFLSDSIAALEAADVDCVTITMGLNDALIEAVNPAQMSYSLYLSNLTTFIEALQTAIPGLVVFLNTVKYANGYGGSSMPALIHRNNDGLRTLVNGTTILMGDETAYALTEAGGLALYTGVNESHPSPAGVELYADILTGVLLRHYVVSDYEDAQYAIDQAAVTADSGVFSEAYTILGIQGTKEMGNFITGANPVTVSTVDSIGTAIPSVTFTVTGAGSARTDSTGELLIGLGDGTWTVTAAATGGIIFESVSITVPGDTECVLVGQSQVITPAPVGQVTMWTDSHDRNGDPLPGVVLQYRIMTSNGTKGMFEGTWGDSDPADAAGRIEIFVPAGSTCEFRKIVTDRPISMTAPLTDTAQINELIWRA